MEAGAKTEDEDGATTEIKFIPSSVRNLTELPLRFTTDAATSQQTSTRHVDTLRSWRRPQPGGYSDTSPELTLVQPGRIVAFETPEQAALRELREETGYVGEACTIPPIVSPLMCMSPGLCDETVKCVVVVVNLDNPYNDPNGALFQATPDEGEFIKVHRVSLKDGFQKMLDEGSSPMAIQGLYLFAMGLEVGKSIR